MADKADKPDKDKGDDKPKMLPKVVKVEGTPHVTEGDMLPNLLPETTAEEDRQTYGQRRINIIWEVTQSIIALAVTGTGMFTAASLALKDDPKQVDKSAGITAFLLISNTVFLVIGFYFGRTNHQRQGGVVGNTR